MSNIPLDEERLPERPSLDDTLARLRATGEGVVSAEIVYGLSALSKDEAETVWPTWSALDPDLRRRVIEALTEASETNFDLDFSAIGRAALTDDASEVRTRAIDLLFEDESFDVMLEMLRLVREDTANEVRANAASALGRFVLMGELGGLNQTDFSAIQQTLLSILDDVREDVDVRRRALEAVANSTHDTIEGAIQEAYESDDPRMRVSALFAMGRTANDRWANIVLEELESDDEEMRFESARAAGELELEEAIPALTQIAFGDDVEIRDTAVWSLGEIGGKEALRVLNLLADEAKHNGDDDFLSAVEDAIASATLGGDSTLYMLRMENQDD